MNRLGETDSSNSLDPPQPVDDNDSMQKEYVTHLHRIDDVRNMARFYRLSTMPSLFGDISLVREWGRMGRPGRIRIDLYAREEDARAACLALEKAKRRRGYRDASGNT